MEDLTSPRVLREILSRYGLAPRKSLGQNFLIDANLRNKIVGAALLRPDDLCVEVGPGPGALTPELLATGAAVIAIEVDAGMAGILRDRLAGNPGRFVLIIGDVLAQDLRQIVEREGLKDRDCVAVANLPYYITTPVIFRLLAAELPWMRLVFLVQREVAERMTARPGTKDFGLLSLMVQYRARPEILSIFPASVFWPPPKVQSALVRLNLPGPPRLPEREEQIFFGLARAAFGQRRKTLTNACRDWAAGLEGGVDLAGACARAGIEPGIRGEDLGVEEFTRLAKEIMGDLTHPPSPPL